MERGAGGHRYRNGSRARHGSRLRVVAGFVLLAALVGSGCSDDEAENRSTGSTSTTQPGDSPLDVPGSHDASVTAYFTIEGDGSGPDPEVDALADLEDRLIDAVEKRGIGELDGDRFEGDQVILTIYGPDLDALWKKVRPVLESYPPRPAYVELRDGGPEQPAKRIDL